MRPPSAAQSRAGAVAPAPRGFPVVACPDSIARDTRCLLLTHTSIIKTPRARRAPGCHPRPAETQRDPRPPDRKGVQASHLDLDVGAGDPHRIALDLSSRRRPHDSPGFDVEPRLGGVLGPP